MTRSANNTVSKWPWIALANIANVHRISGVVRAGKWFDRERLDSMLANVKARVNPTGPD